MNDSGASHITKAIVSITVEETRLQKNKVLRMMLSKKKGAEAPVISYAKYRYEPARDTKRPLGLTSDAQAR
jgi:hypothetical protein